MDNGFRSEYARLKRSLWWQSATAAFVLIALAFLISTFGEGRLISKYGRKDTSTDIIRGDWAVKVSLFYSRLPADRRIPEETRNALPLALVNYRKSAEEGSPAGIRRAGVISWELGKPDASRIFERLTSAKATRGLSREAVARLQSEAVMWGDIYSGSMSPYKTNSYAKRINELNLGPTRAYALKQLYLRSDRDNQAQDIITEATARAMASVIPVTILALALIGAAVAGVVFIVIYFIRRGRRAPRELPQDVTSELEPEIETTGIAARPWVLFQGFVAYLGLMLVLSFLIGEVVSPLLQGMEDNKQLLWLTVTQLGTSLLIGVLAILIFRSVLARSGAKLADIGFSTKNFGKNVLWGCAGYCALLPILIVMAIISSVLFRGFETQEHPIIPMLLSGDLLVFAMLFVIGAVFAPIFEETFFRGALFRGLRWGLPLVPAAALSAVGFAIVHPQLPAGFLPIFAIGAVFSVLVEERDSLIPSMVAHALNNGVIFLAIYFLVLS